MKDSEKPRPKEFGQLLKETRESKGMSHLELSELSRVSTRTIYRLETGSDRSKKIRLDVIIRLALALGEDVKEWVQAGGHPYDAEKVAAIKEMILAGKASSRPIEMKQGSRSQLLAEERALPNSAEVWVIEVEQPAELDDPEVMAVVRGNVHRGITYRYAFPILSDDTGQKTYRWWGWDHADAIARIRKDVMNGGTTTSGATGDIHAKGIAPSEFPLFILNVATVIFYERGKAASEQRCHRIINVMNPKGAWYYQDDPKAASKLIQFLEGKLLGS